MITETQARDIVGTTAYASDGDKIGKVGQLYLDDATGQPDFVTVNTGLFGTSESFVPVREATFEGDRLVLPYSKDKVKDAPNVPADGGHLDEQFEDQLYAYYGIGDLGTTGTGTGYDTAGHDTAGHDAGNAHGTVGHDTSGPTTDEAMTRSEEHLEVGTTSQEAGRARLRKYVTTETETRTVPVEHERAVVEREPVDATNVDQALDGPTISEEEHEVVLREERPVVEKTAEAVERVRLGKETVRDEETVTDEVRKEHIEVEGDVDGGTTGGTAGTGRI